jgi:hypothetical protein
MCYIKHNNININRTITTVTNIFKHMYIMIESIRECYEYRFGLSEGWDVKET